VLAADSLVVQATRLPLQGVKRFAPTLDLLCNIQIRCSAVQFPLRVCLIVLFASSTDRCIVRYGHRDVFRILERELPHFDRHFLDGKGFQQMGCEPMRQRLDQIG
jgi:hypothetical protein